MGKRRYIVLFVCGLYFLGVSCARVTPESHRLAGLHFEQGLELYRQGEVESAAGELEQAVDLDPDMAAAHDLLGRIYLQRGDIRGRWRATQRAQKAVALAPDDPHYRYNLAMVYVERGFGHNARQQFERVLELDRDFWPAHYQIGLLHEESALRYESAERFQKAADALERAVQIAPQEYDVRCHLAMNLSEIERWSEAAEHLEAAVRIEPDRPEAHLLLGVAQQRLGRVEDAEQSYQRAIERMDWLDRMPFENLEYLATAEELEQLPATDRQDFLRRFWKEKDPTPTTRVNERWLEHCRRVAYANIHFAAPKLDLPGWKTKRGEFYIRYGEPLAKWRELGEVSPGVGLVPPRWVWSYGDKGREVSLIFADTFLNGEYNFPFPDKSWGPGEFRNSPAAVAERMVESKPEEYRHDYGAEPLEYACRFFHFRGQAGATDLEVVYGIPNPNLTFTRSGQMAQAVIERQAVLFDAQWNEVARSEQEQSFQVPPTQTANPNRMVVEKADFQVPPGEHWLALSIRDQQAERLGIVKAQVLVENFAGDSLAISSLVLANELVSSAGEERFRRGESVVVPRLGRYFQASRPLQVYYEIYHLAKDRWGETWYQSEYAIVLRPKKKSLVSKAFSALAAPFTSGGRWESVSSTTEYRGTSEMEVGRLQVDMSGAAWGEYLLRLTVTDMNTGQRAQREVEFTLVE